MYDNGRTCITCKHTYANKSSFSKHSCTKSSKGKNVAGKKNFQCDNCNSVFGQKRILLKHIMNKVCIGEKKNKTRKCPECDFQFYRVSKLYEHLFEDHEYNCAFEEKTFNNLTDFQKWKEEQDAYNYINAYNRPGEKHHKETTYKNYVCNFQRVATAPQNNDPGAGTIVSETATSEKEIGRKKGCRKFGITPALECPARMLVKINNEGIVVRYLKTHNHACKFENTKYVHYPQTVRNTIKEKLKQGVEIKRIRKDLIGNFGDRDLRDEDFIDQKQFYNTNKYIRGVQRLMISEQRPSSDAQSVYEKVVKLKEEKFNPVILYKPKGCPTAVGAAYLDHREDLFAIGLQSREQFRIFQEGSKRIVCIDATHGTTKYGFQLLNILVPDERRKGYPVAHFITDVLDKQILKAFFQVSAPTFS